MVDPKLISLREFKGYITKKPQIVAQTGTFPYTAGKVISKYLKPLCQNEYSISDTQQFPDMLSNLPPLLDDEEDNSLM